MAVTPTLRRSLYVGEVVPGYVDVDGETVIPASEAAGLPVRLPGSSPTNPNANPASFITGQLQFTANNRAQLPSNVLMNGLIIRSAVTNAADVLLGGSAVTVVEDGTGNGEILAPGEKVGCPVTNSNVLYVISTAAGFISYSGN